MQQSGTSSPCVDVWKWENHQGKVWLMCLQPNLKGGKKIPFPQWNVELEDLW